VGRIVAIDYGGKRCGIATTDVLQMIANPLTTVETNKLLVFLQNYFAKEPVEAWVVGQPQRHDGSASDIEKEILVFIEKLKTAIPDIPVYRINEMFTSKMAKQSLIDSGVKKKQRKDKALLDSIAATIILQDFLTSR
jgi:putative Holliday junction resolvase